MDGILTKHRSFWICLALTLATAAVFYQVCTHDFVNYDDPEYVYENPNIQAGITPKTIKWAFTTGYFSYWHPLTWLSHMLDWQLFGPNPAGHHLTNLILHIANTLLLFIVLKQMTHTLWPSAFVAALFALHPLHVESVAWVAERKDVLGTLFWILTMWAYARFVSRQKITRYLLVVVFLALGLMAKPMLVTLPFVLLLLDYWPLDRLGPTVNPKRQKTGAKYSLSHLLIEKVPLFAMVLTSCVVTFINQKKVGAIHTEEISFPIRLANASISYLQYINKMIWPARLAFFYQHPGQNLSILYAVISAVLLLAVTILIFRFAKERRYLATGWFWYLGTLVPVIGLVQVGEQALADRYTYITLTGLFIIVAWGIPELLAKLPYRKIVLRTSSLIVLSVLAAVTFLQLRYWKDTITLCQHALKVTENNYIAHCNITQPLIEQNRIEEAIWHSSEALRIKPNYAEAMNSLGVALRQQGRFDAAIALYTRALEIMPKRADIRLNLGSALINIGQLAKAVKEFEKVLLIEPDNALAHNDLAVVLARQGKFDEAIQHLEYAVRLDPDYTTARNNLNIVLAEKQKLQNKAAENTKK